MRSQTGGSRRPVSSAARLCAVSLLAGLLAPAPAPAAEGGKGLPVLEPGKAYTLAQIQVASAHADKPRRGEMIDGNRSNQIGCFWSTFQDTSQYTYDSHLPSSRYWYSIKSRFPYDFNFRFHGAAKDVNVAQVWSRGNTFGGANVQVFAAKEAPEGKVEGIPGYWPWQGVSWDEAPIGSFAEGEAFEKNRDQASPTSVLLKSAKTGALRLRIGQSSEKGPDLVFVNEACFFHFKEGAEEGGEAFSGAAAGPFAGDTGVKAATLKLAMKKGPVTVKVIDPLYPKREHLVAALEAAGDGEATLALDVTDLVVPAGSRLSFEAEGAEVKGGTVRTCDVKEALPEFQAMQTNIMQLWYSVQQLGPGTPGKEQHEIRQQNILKYGGPEAAIARGYDAMLSPKEGAPVYGDPKALFDAPAGAPAWAAGERALWRAYRQFAHWWFDERQMDDGQIGGHFNDDPEFAARWWAVLALMSDEKARTGYRKLADGLWASGRLGNGYITDMYNIEHSNEETTLTEPYALFLHYGNPTYVERCLLTTKNMEWWTALNSVGHRHFLAERYSGDALGDNRNEERYEAAQSLLPGGFALWYADNPRLRQLLLEYTRTYAAHDGKPSGPCIKVGDHRAAANLAIMVHELTGEASLLASSQVKKQKQLQDRTAGAVGGAGPGFFEGGAVRAEVERLLGTEYLHTRGQPLSDRIRRNHTESGQELRLAYDATRVTLGRAAPHKAEELSLFVAWEGMDPDAFAAVVTGGDPKSAKAQVYNFTGKEIEGRARLLALEWGEYDVKAPGAPEKMTLKRGDTLPFKVPAGGTAEIEVKQTKALGEIRGLADVGVGFQDVHADGGKLLVRVHNIGAKDAEAVVVRATDAGGQKIGEETIPSLPYPADLLSREKDLSFAWSGKPGERVRIEVDPDDKVSEITEVNNRLETEALPGPLPKPVGAHWTKENANVAVTAPPPEGTKPPPPGGETPAGPKPPAGGDAKTALAEFKKAIGAAKDFPAKLQAIQAALAAIQDPKARGQVAKSLANEFKKAGAEALHAWAAARFPETAGAEKPTAATIKTALQKEKDPRARASLVAKAAYAFGDEKGKTDWSKMFLQEFGKLKPDALVAWFQEASGGAAAPPPPPPPTKIEGPPAGDGPKPPAEGEKPPAGGTPPPAAKGEGLDENGFPLPVPGEEGEEPYEGFGANPGGRGGKAIEVEANAGAVSAALANGSLNGATLKLKPGDYDSIHAESRFQNVTIDGGGATLWRPNWTVYGKNLVVRNIRLRNSNDNISLKAPCERIVLAHVSTTGSMDDGMSVAYGTRNATIQYCFFGGNTRSTFIKYDGATNMSHHHNWLVKQWIRGPLVHSAFADVRNNVQEDWWAWAGPRFEASASGNCVNCAYVMNGWAHGKIDSCGYTFGNGKGVVHIGGTLAIGFNPVLAKTDSEKPLPAPKVTTQTASEALQIVKERAGCLPRDDVDKKIIEIQKWITVDGKPLRPFVREGGKTVEAPVQVPEDPNYKPGPTIPPASQVAGQRAKYPQVADPKTVPFDVSKLPAGGDAGGEEGGEGGEGGGAKKPPEPKPEKAPEKPPEGKAPPAPDAKPPADKPDEKPPPAKG